MRTIKFRNYVYYSVETGKLQVAVTEKYFEEYEAKIHLGFFVSWAGPIQETLIKE